MSKYHVKLLFNKIFISKEVGFNLHNLLSKKYHQLDNYTMYTKN